MKNVELRTGKLFADAHLQALVRIAATEVKSDVET
jgi:hypothetical protein